MSGGDPDAAKTALARALPFATLLFFLVAAHSLLETARDALFLTRQPISHLPLVFLAVTATVLSLTPLPFDAPTSEARPSHNPERTGNDH